MFWHPRDIQPPSLKNYNKSMKFLCGRELLSCLLNHRLFGFVCIINTCKGTDIAIHKCCRDGRQLVHEQLQSRNSYPVILYWSLTKWKYWDKNQMQIIPRCQIVDDFLISSVYQVKIRKAWPWTIVGNRFGECPAPWTLKDPLCRFQTSFLIVWLPW
jgi:hypothetical protein